MSDLIQQAVDLLSEKNEDQHLFEISRGSKKLGTQKKDFTALPKNPVTKFPDHGKGMPTKAPKFSNEMPKKMPRQIFYPEFKKKLTKEEQEFVDKVNATEETQIDEISKEKLGQYVKRAGHDTTVLALDRQKLKNKSKELINNWRKTDNRNFGINAALDRLTKHPKAKLKGFAKQGLTKEEQEFVDSLNVKSTDK